MTRGRHDEVGGLVGVLPPGPFGLLLELAVYGQFGFLVAGLFYLGELLWAQGFLLFLQFQEIHLV